MNLSVLIVAHNEEKGIRACLESVTNQSIVPDEIVVICHNCTDGTVGIASSFNTVRVIDYKGPEGVPYARIKGFEEARGDIVACLDGDAVADREWLKHITAPLIKDHAVSLVAGYVILTNGIFSRLTSVWQFVILKKIFRPHMNHFAWGSSFACRKADYEKVGGIELIIALRQSLPLHFWAEDFYISLALMQIGKLHVALNAKSYSTIPSWKVNLMTAPTKRWMEDNNALLRYFKHK